MHFFALINPRDAAHARAVAAAEGRPGPLLTTAWVLAEVADGLAAAPDRHLVQKICADLQREPKDVVVPPSAELFNRGLELYFARPDKKWSLTDCISFIVMQDRNVRQALTADHHFEQAGFVALLKD